ncbi:MAG: serine hydrolase [Bacteroidota bacterium]
MGVYVRHLRTDESAAVNADTLFPTVSMVKVPILCAVFNKITLSNIYENEWFVLLRRVLALLWDYFEPDFGWKHVPGHEKWVK